MTTRTWQITIQFILHKKINFYVKKKKKLANHSISQRWTKLSDMHFCLLSLCAASVICVCVFVSSISLKTYRISQPHQYVISATMLARFFTHTEGGGSVTHMAHNIASASKSGLSNVLFENKQANGNKSIRECAEEIKSFLNYKHL